MLYVYFWNKNEKKMFQIDLNSDLKEKPDLKSSCFCHNLLFKPECVQIFLDKYNQECNFLNMLNMRETLRALLNQSSEYLWLCLKKV